MILRLVRFELLEQLEPGYMESIRRVAAEAVGTVDGLLELRIVRSANGRRVTIIGTSLWRDFAAMDAFYGSDLDLPRLLDPHGEFVDSSSIEHFEHVLTVEVGQRSEVPRET
jgi:hypothetical protein